MSECPERAAEVDIPAAVRKIYAPDLLRGKVALVTGASRGIGRSIAVAFAALGAKVIVNYAGNEKAAGETLDLIKTHSPESRIAGFDVSHFAQAQDVIKSLEKEYGALDILVNNAGVAIDGLFVRFKEEDWDRMLDINLKGAFNCSRAALAGMMRRRSGKVVNVSSVIGLSGNGGQAAYAASKAGLLGLTKSLALEFASRNVQVNAIAPGYISTDMTTTHGDALIQKVLTRIPAEHLGAPLDVAKLACFLCSPAADYITGQTMAVDGGMTMI